ncbi:MAG: Holliday junction resolvase RuvX [Aquificaceae bacterium]|nr:Holliday junction resolvase RuvX [Aquificaceae bacterium]
MKVLAIDYGTKWIGLAFGDTRLRLAVPLSRIENRGERVFRDIALKVQELDVSLVLVGMPLTPSGREGQRAMEVREFTQRLRQVLPEEVEVSFWDERYTTFDAYSLMQGLSGSKKRELKDSLSAYALLLEYMESL